MVFTSANLALQSWSSAYRFAHDLSLGLLAISLWVSAVCASELSAQEQSYRRGDANQDALFDIADAVRALEILFDPLSAGTAGVCDKSLDGNDDGAIDLSDAIYLLLALFQPGFPDPAPPFAECGTDPTPDGLTCESFPPCDELPEERTNILLIMSDDLGVAASSCYDQGSVAPTPNIDSLCDQGIVFRNAWAYPVCSPTRASFITGRYAFRHGVSEVGGVLDVAEPSVARALAEDPSLGYASASIGKWHVGGGNQGAVVYGFDYFAGRSRGGLGNYFSWEKSVNGTLEQVDNYATSENVDDALEWIGNRGGQPWFLWLAFNAPHTPFHLPPEELHSASLSGDAQDIRDHPRTYYDAAIEAMDTEIGRLLSSMDSDVLAKTTIIYVGDNGSPARVSPIDGQSKGWLRQGGIHVPLVIAGAKVVSGGREVDSIVDITDLYATVLELAGADVVATTPQGFTIDSVSLLPYLENPSQTDLRPWVLSEQSGGNVDRAGTAIRDVRYKMIRLNSADDEFYDLLTDPTESSNLLDGVLTSAQESALDDLNTTLDGVLAGS